MQRKQGVGNFHPVSWSANKGRRFTSPGPDLAAFSNELPESLELESPVSRMLVESYLDENTDFAESYILRKAKLSTINKWLTQYTSSEIKPQKVDLLTVAERKISRDGPVPSYQNRRTSCVTPTRYSRSSDGSPCLARSKSTCVTPHRRISATMFEEGGLSSPILTTSEDGTLSFLTVPPGHVRPRSKSDIVAPSFSGMENQQAEASQSIVAEITEAQLTFKIAKNLCFASKALSCSVFTIKKVKSQWDTVGDAFSLNTTAINVNEDAEYDSVSEKETSVLINDSNNLLTRVWSGESFSVDNVDNNPDIKPISDLLHESANRLRFIPLVNQAGDNEGLAILCFKDKEPSVETNNNVNDMARLSGISLNIAAEFQSVKLEATRSQVFLDLARIVFDQQTTIEYTVFKILANFLTLIECERSQILLSGDKSPTTFTKAYDLEEDDLYKEDFETRMKPHEGRFPINSVITGLVASRGETVNIGDAAVDVRIDQTINYDAQMTLRSVLCMPIKDSDSEILGVISLINKKSGSFTDNDEKFVEAFGVFCGMALRNVSNYETAKQAEARSQVALEIMAYHASSCEDEAMMLAQKHVPAALTFQLRSFQFTDMALDDEDTIRASMRMFMDLDLMNKFNIEQTTLCRWLLTVKKNYRTDVKYHNWRHAFSVAQVMFSSIVTSGWWSGLGDTACLGLLVACLSHDLDHRGTNNDYQLAINSPLAKLYSTSTLERHHLNQALILLNLEGNQILKNLSPEQYSSTLAVVEEAILATDLSLHFQHLSRLQALASSGQVNWDDDEQASIARAALMTGSDLGSMTRPFPVQQVVAGLISEEFWDQGDKERETLGAEPRPLLDRSLQHQMPNLQVGFCEGVCLPVYKALADLSPALSPLLDGARSNRERWAQLAENNQDHKDVEEEEENNVTRNL